MSEEARKIVETIKEAFEALAAMELPAEEQWCEINRDNAMTLIVELEQVPEQEKVANEFDYTLKVAEKLQKDFESHAGSVDYLCSQVRHAVNIIKRISAQLEQVTRERNAAVEDLKEADLIDCMHCKAYEKNAIPCQCDCESCEIVNCVCKTCVRNSNWQWRGVEVE